MKHTLLYMGRLSLNFDDLSPDSTEYAKADGSKAPFNQPSSTTDGIVFGYMEKPGYRCFAVKVGDVVLDVPVQLEPDRHSDGKNYGPQPSQFGDASARALLADMIRYNPAQAEDILRTVWKTIAKA
jgi:hypothetical protein